MNLDFAKVCGKHSAIFEAYYKQIDPKGSGAIEAMTAAKFLKKSGLSDVVLSRIWDLSDPNGKGFLDKPGFFVALKLVSLAQAGQVINMSNIYVETANPPKVGDLPKIMPQRMPPHPGPPVPTSIGSAGIAAGATVTGDWSIGVIERLKYEQLFESLKPINNMLPGNKVKGVLMDSKLPTDTLGKIWDLADQDKDGNLDKHEFIVAMHLVAQTLEKRIVPDVLPLELRKSGGAMPPKPAPPIVGVSGVGVGEGFADSGGFVANFPKDIAPPPIVPPPMVARLPPVGGTGTTPPLIGNTDAPLIPIGGPPSAADWVVTPAEQKRFEIMFRQSDLDKDGLVSGLEVKNIFLQSGVPQNCLAHIWALCDTNQSGKLTLEQFALAMWLVERKQRGIEPPQVLMANMVPPSMRAIVPGVDMQPQPEPRPTYSNPELEMISKEIEELAKERRALELEIAQKESDIHIKKGEVRSLQGELDTLLATLKQLENQRGEAQKRLDDLKAQVNKIREQCQKQEDTINDQEGELNAKRSELQKLKDEETSLQKEYDENNRELQKLTNHLQNTQLQISSVRSMVTQLLEVQRQMTDALLMCRAAIENQDGELVSEYQLKIEPDFDEAKKTLEKKIEMQETPKADSFHEEEKKDAMKSTTTTNGFAANGFESDPFVGGVGTTATTKTSIRSGFDDSFNTTIGFDSGNFDAFGSSSVGGFGMQQRDPFGSDAFGANKSSAITPEPGKDDFGSDPFAALHAPTGQGQVLSPNAQQKSGPPPRPESPSPALPPKKGKVPPPRPAPPRPLQGPTRPAQPDAFGGGSTSTGGSGFADFADFDNKQFANAFLLSTTTTTTPITTTSTSLSTTMNNNKNNNTILDLFNTTNNKTLTTTNRTITPSQNIDLSSNSNSSSSNLSLLADLGDVSGVGVGIGGYGGISTSSVGLSGFDTSLLSSSSSLFHTKQQQQEKEQQTTTTSTTNNHLTRSITPSMQQQTADSTTTTTTVFEAFDKTKATIATLTTTTKTTHAAATTMTTTSTIATTKKSISGPTDFSDDPFKDYRYEDPFSIKDPFDDAEDDIAAAVVNDPSKLFKDDFEDDDDDDKIATINKSSHNQEKSLFEIPMKAITPALSNEFINQFDAFGLNPSPVPSHQSTASVTKKSQEKLFDNFADFDAFSAKSNESPIFATKFDEDKNENKSKKIKTSTMTTLKNDSFFDAFNDNFISKNDSNTKTTTTTTQKTSIFDAFDNDDDNDNNLNKNQQQLNAFAMTTTTTTMKSPSAFDNAFNSNSNNNNKNTTIKQISNNFEDDFDAFGNSTTTTMSMMTTTTTTTTKSSTTTNKTNLTKNIDTLHFDKFDAFNDCVDFPTDFSSTYTSSTLNNTSTLGSTKSALSSLSTTSSFSSLQKPTLKKVQNETIVNKKSNWNAGGGGGGGVGVVAGATTSEGIKLPEKFAADYSKPESFDDDLEEAIKRSMIDQ